MNKFDKSFMFYPEITDKDFYEKIYLKKEFRDYEIQKIKNYKENYEEELKTKSKYSKELEPFQHFLKNYISPDTPYNGVIIFHGPGVGKTCSSISIAEGFKKTLKNIGKKILVITTVKNFITEIFDYDKEIRKKYSDDNVQCTGAEYKLGSEYKYLTDAQKKKEIINRIKSYYQITGYTSFANYIIESTGGWKGDESTITENIINFISAEFDDRIIIIDEIQNIKTSKQTDLTKNIQPILQTIIKYAKNVKLILMSATPMFDRPDEIIFYINLLLLNDRRPLINRNDIFNTLDGSLKNGADDILRKLFKGYVSYIRAEKPFVFPFRLYPKTAITPTLKYSLTGSRIEKNNDILYSKLVLANMSNVQAYTYLYHLSKKINDGKLKNNINSFVQNSNTANENNKFRNKFINKLKNNAENNNDELNINNTIINELDENDLENDNSNPNKYRFIENKKKQKKNNMNDNRNNGDNRNNDNAEGESDDDLENFNLNNEDDIDYIINEEYGNTNGKNEIITTKEKKEKKEKTGSLFFDLIKISNIVFPVKSSRKSDKSCKCKLDSREI